MRALVITDAGASPELSNVADPAVVAGEALLEVHAASLNPADISVASGHFFGGQPKLPYVPGIEAAGVLRGATDQLVFACLDGLGIARNGTCAELAAVRVERLIALPDGTDPIVAAGVGTAGIAGWSPLVRRAPVRRGDVVVVLGATGTAGLVAVQAAKLLGADWVVAAGRRRAGLDRAGRLGADAAVELSDEGLAERLLSACNGVAPTYVFDPLWGVPARAALEAAAPGARIVQLGQAASAEASVPSRLIRGKDLNVFGFTNLNLDPEALAADYLSLLEHVTAGRIEVEIEPLTLADGVAAWARQTAGPGHKLVIYP